MYIKVLKFRFSFLSDLLFTISRIDTPSVMATKTYFTFWSLLIFGILVCIARVIAFLDIDEINSVHYGIEILKEPILLPKESIPQSVQLKSKFGQQYQCSFPDHNEQEKLNEEVEKVAMEAGIPELLRPLGKRPCLFKTKDWWSYEFCYGRYIRQYHMEDQKPVGDIIYLGYFESEYNWENTTEEEITLRKKHEQNRYHSQRYVNGTKCDLNGEGRKTEVRFMCEEGNGDFISQIDEPETCVYVLTVYTATICHHPYLKAPTPSKPISITCNPVLAQEQYDAYLEHIQSEGKQKKMEKEKLLEGENTELPGNEKELTSVDLSKSLKIHLTSSPEEATAVFKGMLSSGLSSSPDKPFGKSLFTDDNSVANDQSHASPSDQGDVKESSYEDETDNVKTVEDLGTESSIITTETSKAFTTKNEVDFQKDVIDDNDDEFSGNLNKEIAEAKEHFVSTKEKLQSVLQAQFKDLVTEAADVLLEDQPEQRVNQLATTKKLANTLKLLNKLEKTEKELKIVDKAIEEHKKIFEKSKLTSDQISTSSPSSGKTSQSDDNSSEGEQEKEEKNSVTMQNSDEKNLPLKEAETRIKVRVTKIKSGGVANVEKELPTKERQKLEQSVKEGLEKAGLESIGDKIQVSIITAGYYDSDDDSLKVLSDEDTAAFKNMIVAILGGNDDATKEIERYKQLEENYSFVWQNGKQIKKSAPK